MEKWELTLSMQSFRHCGTFSCAKNSLWFTLLRAACTNDKCTKHITKIAHKLEVRQLLKMWIILRLHHVTADPWQLPFNTLGFRIMPVKMVSSTSIFVRSLFIRKIFVVVKKFEFLMKISHKSHLKSTWVVFFSKWIFHVLKIF